MAHAVILISRLNKHSSFRANVMPDFDESLEDRLLVAQMEDLEIDLLAKAIRQGVLVSRISEYLNTYDRKEVVQALLVPDRRTGRPLMFDVVDRCDTDLLQALLSFDDGEQLANVSAVKPSVPLLAHGILASSSNCKSSLALVKHLLAHGADPDCIPISLWRDPFEEAPKMTDSEHSKLTEWCMGDVQRKLEEAMTYSQRYFLWKAHSMPRARLRERQIASVHGIETLFHIPYQIIGQHHAGELLKKYIFSHITHQIEKPLCLVFAGPSGHGKTELARQLGNLLRIDHLVIDCTSVSGRWGFVGPPHGYSGNDKGSLMNNFLAEQHGNRSIVFLDEFEKSDCEAQMSLLQLLDSGEYVDRRKNLRVDCSRTIFMLATNEGDSDIRTWSGEHMAGKSDAQRAKVDIEPLIEVLRATFTVRFGAPLAGRFSWIVPFLPFSPGEQAAVAHKVIEGMAMRLREPVNLAAKRMIGHIHLATDDDFAVCQLLAERGYVQARGARSIETAAIRMIRLKVDEIWMEGTAKIDDDLNNGPLEKLVVAVGRGKDGPREVIVSKGPPTFLVD